MSLLWEWYLSNRDNIAPLLAQAPPRRRTASMESVDFAAFYRTS
jgi:hypothetical protein